LLANGIPRQAIKILAYTGILLLYYIFNENFNNIAVKTKKFLKWVAKNRNIIIVYNNFNFINRKQNLIGGQQSEIVNFTIACIIFYFNLYSLY